ncbi:hypothetical protein PVK06_012300 [Gossypium arboreum]|uniref:Uncharacterized protein n=1 Tax=Gossypium arboreum TaxID=29729 RepID=A0ABR0QBY8_GOSAR|nr:hypothetical protein PVK06_012300 [Gossypium arboreum]
MVSRINSLLESQSREENIMKITARKRMLEVAGRRLERKNVRKEEWYNNVEAGAGGNTALARVLVPVEKKGEGRSSVDRESNNQQLIQLEEKDVVTSMAIVLFDLCGLREWMAMEKLHTEHAPLLDSKLDVATLVCECRNIISSSSLIGFKVGCRDIVSSSSPLKVLFKILLSVEVCFVVLTSLLNVTKSRVVH